MIVTKKQGSLHYTPEHCLYFGGRSHVSTGCAMYLLRSPEKANQQDWAVQTDPLLNTLSGLNGTPHQTLKT